MGGLVLGGEILAICASWSLGGWFLGRLMNASWPLVACSLAGIVHALYAIVRVGSRKS